MEQVFTSYSSRDAQPVDTIVGRLSQAGLRVWLDRAEIKAGNAWSVQIVEAIDTCPAFVLMLSPNSAASKEVHQEVYLSHESKHAIFIVMLEPVKIPNEIRYQLAGKQILSVERLGLDKVIEELTGMVREYVAQFEPVEPPANRQVEMVIQGINLKDLTPDKQAQVLDLLAQLTGADRSQLEITKLEAGSVHVFVDMPRRAAYELKTAALNKDPRFKQLGIVSLRLDGDQNFVNTASGKLTALATVSPLMALWLRIPALFSSALGATGGKIATLVLGAALLAGAGTAVSGALTPASAPPNTPTATLTATPAPSSTSTATPAGTSTPTQTATSTLTPTGTPTPPASPTASLSPVPTYLTLRGQPVRAIACNYGPGDIYLYQEAMNPRYQMDVFGKALIHYRGKEQTWLYTQTDGFQGKCFVNAADIELMGGGLEDLKKVYPGEVKLPISTLWPVPQNIKTLRLGDQVTISWDFFDLPGGERERPNDENKPRYLLELWLCKDGELQFTPTGSWDLTVPRSTLQVIDEAGCAESSHGVIYLAEKHGYDGPVEIPWPAYPAPTATP
jgi:hypothetical protein